MPLLPIPLSCACLMRQQDPFGSEVDPPDNVAYELNKDLIKEHDIYNI